MAFEVVTYNIHYGIGIDGAYDIPRIADSVRGADIILFQEVSRNLGFNGGAEMVADLRAALPDRFAAIHMPTDIDFGSAVKDGVARETRFQFGNMVLSRFPILAMRGHLLPRARRSERLNLQRGALETLIAMPSGPARFICVHLDHVGPGDRPAQIAALQDIMADEEGPGASGLGEFGFPELPRTDHVFAAGDFNFFPHTRDHLAMTEGNGIALVDVSPPGDVMSFHVPGDDPPFERLDYGFATTAFAPHFARSWVDADAVGSDHKPVWFEIA